MSNRRWISVTVLVTLLAGGVVALADARADIYGLFRDTRGRRLPIYGSERRGKYLLNMRYVPQNFVAVLLGSSVTSNWNTGAITALRTYNESINGGNLSEEKLLVETALAAPDAPKLKVAICVVHPYLTDSRGLHAPAEMKPAERWAALGSTSLLQAYKVRRAVEHGSVAVEWDAFGTQHQEEVDGLRPLNPVLTRIMNSDGEVPVDEGAFAEYAAMVAGLRRQGVRLVAVVPPTMEEVIGPRRAPMTRYVQRVLALFGPEDSIVDFDTAEHAAFRLDRRNFRDGVHLSLRGAETVVKILDARLLAWQPQK